MDLYIAHTHTIYKYPVIMLLRKLLASTLEYITPEMLKPEKYICKCNDMLIFTISIRIFLPWFINTFLGKFCKNMIMNTSVIHEKLFTNGSHKNCGLLSQSQAEFWNVKWNVEIFKICKFYSKNKSCDLKFISCYSVHLIQCVILPMYQLLIL